MTMNRTSQSGKFVIRLLRKIFKVYPGNGEVILGVFNVIIPIVVRTGGGSVNYK